MKMFGVTQKHTPFVVSRRNPKYRAPIIDISIFHYINEYIAAHENKMWKAPTYSELKERLLQTPALSVGILIFAVLFNALLPKDSTALVLYPDSPLKLNLNALSFYIFPHVNWIHLLVNLFSLFPLLSAFEKANGTVRTGVTLNLLAVVTALMYCIPGLLLYPKAGVAGLLGIVFSLLTYFCQKEHAVTPVILLFKVAGRDVSIPTEYFQFVALFLTAVIIPSTSFFGHLAGIGAGYLLAFGYIEVLYPPLKVILFIEKKLAPGIAKLKLLVDFVSEDDAVVLRGNAYSPMFTNDIEAPASEPQTYESFERRLGT